MNRARFGVMRSTATSLVIEDLGPWDQHPTVTNDAEGVVHRLHVSGRLSPGVRLFYYDSDGDYSELKHDGAGRFAGFAPAREEEHDAL